MVVEVASEERGGVKQETPVLKKQQNSKTCTPRLIHEIEFPPDVIVKNFLIRGKNELVSSHHLQIHKLDLCYYVGP